MSVQTSDRNISENVIFEMLGRLYVSWQLAVRERDEAIREAAMLLRKARPGEERDG